MGVRGEIRGMKAKLEKISRSLKSVHKHLLENEKVAAEIRLDRKLNPLDFFSLITQDESYSWMKPLSALMAEIDEFIDENDVVNDADVESIRRRVDFILRDPSSKVSSRYLQYLAQDPDFILAHAELRSALGPPPKAAKDPNQT